MQDSEKAWFTSIEYLELPTELNISLVFNILDLKEFYEGGDGDEVIDIQWSILIATSNKKEIEEILDSHVGRSTRNKTYKEYLVKWKGRPIEDSSWLAQEEVDHLGFPLNTWDMMGSLLKLPQVFDAGASWV